MKYTTKEMKIQKIQKRKENISLYTMNLANSTHIKLSDNLEHFNDIYFSCDFFLVHNMCIFTIYYI